MNQLIKYSKWVYFSGISIIILGIIHLSAAFIIYPQIKHMLPSGESLTFLDMFLSTGIAVVFAGILIIYSSRSLKNSEQWAWNISLASGLFMLLLGVASVVFMYDNPFAYLTVVLAVIELIPLFLCKRIYNTVKA